MHLSQYLSWMTLSASAVLTLAFAAQEVEMQEMSITASEGSTLAPSPTLMNQIQPPPQVVGLAQERVESERATLPSAAVGPLTGPASQGRPLSGNGNGLHRKAGHGKGRGRRQRHSRHKLAHIFHTALYLMPSSASNEAEAQDALASTTPKGGAIIAGIVYTHSHALLYLHDGKDDLDAFDGKAKPSIKRSVLRLDIKGADLPDGPDEDPATGLMCFETSAVYGYIHGKNLASPPQKVKICGNLDQKLKNVFKFYNSIKKIKTRGAKKQHAVKSAAPKPPAQQ